MKRILSTALSLVFFAAMFFGAVPVVSAEEAQFNSANAELYSIAGSGGIEDATNVIINEDFTGKTTANIPSANGLITNSLVGKWGGATTEVTASMESEIGGKDEDDVSLKLTGTAAYPKLPLSNATPTIKTQAIDTTNNAKYVIKFSILIGNTVIANANNRNIQVFYGGTATYPITFMTGDLTGGVLRYGTTSLTTDMPVTKRYETGKWYKIAYIYDKVTDSFDLYINDKLELEKKPTGVAAPTSSSEIRLNTSEGETYFDDIQMYTLPSTVTYDPTVTTVAPKTANASVYVKNRNTNIYVKDTSLTAGTLIDALDITDKVNFAEELTAKIFTNYALTQEVASEALVANGNILVVYDDEDNVKGSYNIFVKPNGIDSLINETFNNAVNTAVGNVSIKNADSTSTKWAKWGYSDSLFNPTVSVATVSNELAGKAASDKSINITTDKSISQLTAGNIRYHNPTGTTFPVPLAIDNKLVFSYSVLPMDKTAERSAQLFFNGAGTGWTQGYDYYFVRFKADGTVKTGGDSGSSANEANMANIRTYEAGIWYNVVCVIDRDAHTYDVYINGSKEVSNRYITRANLALVNSLSEIRMSHTPSVGIQTTYYDDFVAYNLYGDYDPTSTIASVVVADGDDDKVSIDAKAKRILLKEDGMTVEDVLECVDVTKTAKMYSVDSGNNYTELLPADLADGSKLVITALDGITLNYYDVTGFNMFEISSTKYTINDSAKTISGWLKFTTVTDFVANITAADSSVNMEVYNGAGVAKQGDNVMIEQGMIFRLSYDMDGNTTLTSDEIVNYTIGAQQGAFLEDDFNGVVIDTLKWTANGNAGTMAGLISSADGGLSEKERELLEERDGNVIKMAGAITANDIRLTKTGFNTVQTNGVNVVETSMMVKDKNVNRGVTVRGATDNTFANIFGFYTDGTIKVFNTYTVAEYEVDRWYNLAVAWDTPNRAVKVYIDGVEIPLTLKSDFTQEPISTVFLVQGNNAAGTTATTYFDDFKFYPVYSLANLDYSEYSPVVTADTSAIAFNDIYEGTLMVKQGLTVAEITSAVTVPSERLAFYNDNDGLIVSGDYETTYFADGMYMVVSSGGGYGSGGTIKNTLKYNIIANDVHYTPISLISDASKLTASINAVKYTNDDEKFCIIIGVYEGNKMVGFKASPQNELVKDTAAKFSLDYDVVMQAGQYAKAMIFEDLNSLYPILNECARIEKK